MITSMTAGKSLSQIADQSAANGIGENKTGNNAVFPSVRNPACQADIAVDLLDVDAFAEHIQDDDRFAQGRVFVMFGHFNPHSLRSEPLRSVASNPSGVLLPATGEPFTLENLALSAMAIIGLLVIGTVWWFSS